MLRKPICEYRFDVVNKLSPGNVVYSVLILLKIFSWEILNVALDVVSDKLFGDDSPEGACILDPFNQPSVATQRHDAVSAQAKALLTGFRVRFKHSVT